MSRQQQKYGLRFALAGALLAGASLFLHSRSHAEQLPPRSELSSFPLQIGEWSGRELRIPPEVIEVLGDGEFLQRSYFRSPDEPPVELFLAFFPTQRAHSTIHSPQNCLPGAGWAPVERRFVELSGSDGRSELVNRFVIAKGPLRQVVFYWYQSQGRIEPSEYWAKFYLVSDAIRSSRSDGGMVRIITPVLPEEPLEIGTERAAEFGITILSMLDYHFPK